MVVYVQLLILICVIVLFSMSQHCLQQLVPCGYLYKFNCSCLWCLKLTSASGDVVLVVVNNQQNLIVIVYHSAAVVSSNIIVSVCDCSLQAHCLLNMACGC